MSNQIEFLGNCKPCFSPDGECLSFASPKESHQRKGDPSSSPFGCPSRDARTGAPPTRPGGSHKTRPTAELRQGSVLFPSARLDSATQQGEPRGRSTNNRKSYCSAKDSMLHPLGPLLCRREAQPHGETRRRVSELRSEPRFVRLARASCGAAPWGEHRREAVGRHSRGGLLFGYFFLATQEKVARHQAKSPVGYCPKSQT